MNFVRFAILPGGLFALWIALAVMSLTQLAGLSATIDMKTPVHHKATPSSVKKPVLVSALSDGAGQK